jgi:GNAT superfamily N-acetyltransferase
MSEIPFRLSPRLSPLEAIAERPGVLPGLPALVARLRAWWHQAVGALTYSLRYASALQELRGIDARTLKDVGLHRGDLHAVAYATARRGAFGRFGGIRIRRVESGDLLRCVQFARLLHPQDIRQRFGQPAALADGETFRRLFGLDDRKIETIGAFDLSGQILALATVAWVAPGIAELGFIVRSDVQRRGLGATLVAHVIKSARGAGFHLLLANIGCENLPARQLARRFGFEFDGTAVASTEAQLMLA